MGQEKRCMDQGRTNARRFFGTAYALFNPNAPQNDKISGSVPGGKEFRKLAGLEAT
jgi:hypothetical protein